ncbi:hypothetical protein R3P38DRAFT_526670 [Favolaschia claudopus]|uniref:DUF6532 domain-containing protein n=1 Tax=Favolaschia claudopus TaxID=2862362 RepID=A0AAV9ZB67_9AGAR
MARPVLSDSDDSDSGNDSGHDSGPGTPSPKVSATKRPVRAGKKSQKQQENEDRSIEAATKEIAKLRKQLAKSKQKTAQTKAVLRERDDNAPESEDSEHEPVDLSSFSSSIISKGVFSRKPTESAPKKLRKSKAGDTAIPTQTTTRRADELSEDDEDDGGDGTPPPPSDLPSSDPPTSDPPGPEDHQPHAPPHRKRARSSSPAAKSHHKRKKSKAPLAKAEFVAGKPPGGSRTNLKDYTEAGANLIKRAQHLYEVHVWTRVSYPGAVLQLEIVKNVWDIVCTEAQSPMELTDRMASMIAKYGAHGRSYVVDKVRPLIASAYGFKTGSSDKVKDKNIATYKMLLEESAFHYKDPETRTGFAKNDIIMDAIVATWFKTKSGRGITYSDYFSPIPLVTLALIFTVIEFGIQEWSTGQFQQATFDETANKVVYDNHLRDLIDWDSLKPEVTSIILQRMHDEARAGTGAALIKASGRMTEEARERALAELEAMDVDA